MKQLALILAAATISGGLYTFDTIDEKRNNARAELHVPPIEPPFTVTDVGGMNVITFTQPIVITAPRRQKAPARMVPCSGWMDLGSSEGKVQRLCPKK